MRRYIVLLNIKRTYMFEYVVRMQFWILLIETKQRIRIKNKMEK